MYVKYGSYTFPLGWPAVAISRQTEENDAFQPLQVKERWDINGLLTASSSSALQVLILALEAAFSVNDRSLYILMADGSTSSAHYIDTSLTNGGVRVVSPVSYPVGAGAEGVTYRTFTVSLEALIPVRNSENLLRSFEESITFTGNGGPTFGLIETRKGPPVRQQTREHSIIRAVQSGKAVGYMKYPSVASIAPPFWPKYLMQDQTIIVPGSPKRSGGPSNITYTDWPVSWSYFYESNEKLLANPHVWKG